MSYKRIHVYVHSFIISEIKENKVHIRWNIYVDFQKLGKMHCLAFPASGLAQNKIETDYVQIFYFMVVVWIVKIFDA